MQAAGPAAPLVHPSSTPRPPSVHSPIHTPPRRSGGAGFLSRHRPGHGFADAARGGAPRRWTKRCNGRAKVLRH